MLTAVAGLKLILLLAQVSLTWYKQAVEKYVHGYIVQLVMSCEDEDLFTCCPHKWQALLYCSCHGEQSDQLVKRKRQFLYVGVRVTFLFIQNECNVIIFSSLYSNEMWG